MGAKGQARGPSGGRRTRPLAWLLSARVVLTLLVFGVALSLDRLGRPPFEAAQSGLYLTVAAAFLSTAAYGALLRGAAHVGAFGAAQVCTDVAIVTALVVFSGGHESIFSFLYVPVAVYGALLFDRRGALGTAALASAAYGGALAAVQAGVVGGAAASSAAPALALLARFGVHAGAITLAAYLASVLAGELRRTGEALDASASDLRRLRNLHERIVESLTSGLLTTDPEGRITSFNAEAERITGTPGAAAFGRHLDAVLPGARELVRRDPPGAEGAGRRRMPFRSRDGRELHLGLAASTLRDTDGCPSGWVVIFQDVTRIVRMEQELRRSERLAASGQLAAGIAHEVRNPLAAISGSMQMLRSGREGGAEPDAEQERLMEIVLRETDRLNALITDFLAYARPAPPKRKPVAVRELVQEVLEMFEASRPSGVEVRTCVAPGLRAYADPDQLRELLWNLVLNAAQAMPEGGRLDVEARALPPAAAEETPQEGPSEGRNGTGQEGPVRIELRVSDTGVGIPPDLLERIFDPFFTTKRGGSGLGLANVHRIVEGNGGRLRVQSSPDAGTEFRIALPGAAEGQ